MHAVVGTVTIHDFERGLPVLREQIVPRVKQAPGLLRPAQVPREGSDPTRRARVGGCHLPAAMNTAPLSN
jgi:hypothetical protein